MDEHDTKELIINPYYAINIPSSLAAEHEPMVSKEKWIRVNTKLMKSALAIWKQANLLK